MRGAEEAQRRLVEAEWRRRSETQAIFAALDGAAGRTRAVGGVVRDTVLGRSDVDIDMATELLPQEVLARAERAGIAAYPTGIAHGTITLRLGETLVEVTTLRRDVETDGRHAVVAFGTDWREDAARRDFTLNALYAFADGTLFDPLGGLDDALEGRVRFIGDPGQRIAEDGLRVFRFFRFSARFAGQSLDAAALNACANAVGALDHLSAERVGGEMLRMLALPRIAATLRVMVGIGLLGFGEGVLTALERYEARGGQASAGRLALLLEEVDPQALQSAWRLSNEAVRVAIEVRSAARLLLERQFAPALYRYGASCREGLLVAAALSGWGTARIEDARKRLDGLVVPAFPIGGGDLIQLGMKPGPLLGQELARLEGLWLESEFALDRQALLAAARVQTPPAE